jgi:hypothetical protein
MLADIDVNVFDLPYLLSVGFRQGETLAFKSTLRS